MISLVLLASTLVGPSSSQSPYVVPTGSASMRTISILTTGDTVNGYAMAAIPDGLGAFDNGDGTFTLLMNHEIPETVDVRRAHGGIGATISRWRIRKSDLAVLEGRDHVQQVYRWNLAAGAYVHDPAYAFDRLCSATLADVSASFDAETGTGYNGRLFLNGEEAGSSGRAFAHTLDGISYELPRLGRAAWENQVPHYGTGLKTVVVGLDDDDSGQVYVYVGTKTNSGTPADRAGLNNGRLYGVKVVGLPVETNQGFTSARFELVNLGDLSNDDGIELEEDSVAAGVTAFQRPEDGAWDPSRPRDFYFTTTGVTALSRLWRLRFDNVDDVTDGGRISLVFDDTDGPRAMDNITITRDGWLYLQEDNGAHERVSAIWAYNLVTGDDPIKIAQHDPMRFGAGGTLTIDEESSGIIDATDVLGPGWLLFTSQAHFKGQPDSVQGGQLLAAQFLPRRRSVRSR
jgi:hypothetical protein